MIYIVEDDQSIRELECYALKQAGFEVEGFEQGTDFFEMMRTVLPEIILLDVMLPGEDGIAILEKIRNNPITSHIPVLMVTAKGTELNKVKALDLGADDYIVKPFGVMELISRVKAVLRRTKSPEKTTKFVVGKLVLDTKRHSVMVGDEVVALTPMEFDLLHYMLLNQGIALTREQILQAVWGITYTGDTRTVDVHMGSLRSKLHGMDSLLKTVRGVGYKLEANNAKENS